MTNITSDAFGPIAKEEPLRLHGLKIKNYRRIEAVDLQFSEEAGIVEIRGANEQGKTTLIDAVWEAIGGSPRPDAIRKGSAKAEVEVDLGELRVVRRWTKGKNGVTSSLKVTDANGETVSKPQELLSSLLSRVSIDPLAWVEKGLRGKAGRREQAEDLLAALAMLAPVDELMEFLDPLGIAFDTEGHALQVIGSAKKAVEAARADVGRRSREAESTFEALAAHAGDLDKPAPNPDEVREARAAASNGRKLASNVALAEDRVERLRAELEQETQRLDALQLELADLGSLAELEARAEELADLAQSAALAQGAREAREKRDTLAKRHAAHDAAFKAVGELMEATLASVDLPVEGLAFDEDGLTYKGRPFPESASGEERITVGLGVAMASSPRLKLLRVDDGNRLDRFNREQVRRMVEEAGFKLLLVLVDEDGTEPGIVIEDGKAREVKS